ncbi:MAG: putative PEP-binding protein [Candidatus Omnitrophota bacterium]
MAEIKKIAASLGREMPDYVTELGRFYFDSDRILNQDRERVRKKLKRIKNIVAGKREKRISFEGAFRLLRAARRLGLVEEELRKDLQRLDQQGLKKMEHRFVLRLEDPRISSSARRFGQKAARLISSSRIIKGSGLYLPRALIISSFAFGKFLDDNQLTARLAGILKAKDLSALEKSRAAGALIQDGGISAGLGDLIQGEYAAVLGDKESDVRASAIMEHNLYNRFYKEAGVTRDNVLSAVQKVWSEYFSEEVVAYLQSMAAGLEIENYYPTLLIQEKIDAVACGYATTVNPTTRNWREAVINVARGSEWVFSGDVPIDADRIIIDGEGNTIEDVPGEGRPKSIMAPEAIKALYEAGKKLEGHFGRSLIIEFMLDRQGRIFVFSVMPFLVFGEMKPASIRATITDSMVQKTEEGVLVHIRFESDQADLEKITAKRPDGSPQIFAFSPPPFEKILNREILKILPEKRSIVLSISQPGGLIVLKVGAGIGHYKGQTVTYIDDNTPVALEPFYHLIAMDGAGKIRVYEFDDLRPLAMFVHGHPEIYSQARASDPEKGGRWPFMEWLYSRLPERLGTVWVPAVLEGGAGAIFIFALLKIFALPLALSPPAFLLIAAGFLAYQFIWHCLHAKPFRKIFSNLSFIFSKEKLRISAEIAALLSALLSLAYLFSLPAAAIFLTLAIGLILPHALINGGRTILSPLAAGEILIKGKANQIRRIRKGIIIVHKGIQDIGYIAYSLQLPWDSDEAVRFKIRNEQNALDESAAKIYIDVPHLGAGRYGREFNFRAWLSSMTFSVLEKARGEIARQKMNAEYVVINIIEKEAGRLRRGGRFILGPPFIESKWADELSDEHKQEIIQKAVELLEGFGRRLEELLCCRYSLEVKGDPDRTEKNISEEIENFRAQLEAIKRAYREEMAQQREAGNLKGEEKIEPFLSALNEFGEEMMGAEGREGLIRREKETAVRILIRYTHKLSLTRLKAEGKDLPTFSRLIDALPSLHELSEGEKEIWEGVIEISLNIRQLIARLSKGKDFKRQEDSAAQHQSRVDDELARAKKAFRDISPWAKEKATQMQGVPEKLSLVGLLSLLERHVERAIKKKSSYAQVAIYRSRHKILSFLRRLLATEEKKENTPDFNEQNIASLETLISLFERALDELGKNVEQTIEAQAQPYPNENLILVADNMTFPLLKKTRAAHPNLAVTVTRDGTPAAHWSIYAGNEGIVTLTGAKGNLAQVKAGALAYVDGVTGELLVNPNWVSRYLFERRRRLMKAFRRMASQKVGTKVQTQDGIALTVEGNASTERELRELAAVSLGVGLLRTEFAVPFALKAPPAIKKTKKKGVIQESIMTRERLNSKKHREEFFSGLNFYAESLLRHLRLALMCLPGSVVMRTLDRADDKMIPGIPDSPHYGLDFYFEGQVGREIVRAQMRTAVEAYIAAEINNQEVREKREKTRRLMGQIKILFPLVQTEADVHRLMGIWSDVCQRKKQEYEQRRRTNLRLPALKFSSRMIPVGFMIETPGALTILPKIFSYGDFVSIGSNDLTSRLFGVRRERAADIDYFTKLQPKLLVEIENVAREAFAREKGAGICGELGGKTAFALFAVYLAYKYRAYSTKNYAVDFKLSMDYAQVALTRELIRFADARELNAAFDGYELMTVQELNCRAEKMVKKIERRIRRTREFREAYRFEKRAAKRPGALKTDIPDASVTPEGAEKEAVTGVPAAAGSDAGDGNISSPLSPRGSSGLDNGIYTPAIQDAIRSGNFVSFGFDNEKKRLLPRPLLLDNGELISGGVLLTGEQASKINQLFAKLPEALRDCLTRDLKACLIFIPDFNRRIRQRMSPGTNACRNFLFGAHYGLSRPQYYFDISLFQNGTYILFRQLWHELSERRTVLAGLKREERGMLFGDRPAALERKINRLTREKHLELITREVVLLFEKTFRHKFYDRERLLDILTQKRDEREIRQLRRMGSFIFKWAGCDYIMTKHPDIHERSLSAFIESVHNWASLHEANGQCVKECGKVSRAYAFYQELAKLKGTHAKLFEEKDLVLIILGILEDEDNLKSAITFLGCFLDEVYGDMVKRKKIRIKRPGRGSL